MIQSLDEILLSYINDESFKSYKKRTLAQYIIDNDKRIKLGLEAIRKRIAFLKQSQEEPQDIRVHISGKSIEDPKEKYNVRDDQYHFYTPRGNFSLSIEFIDQMFFEYAAKGMNLSQTQMINKHNLDIWKWNTIKSALWLFKTSHIFSPHTVEITPPELMATMIEQKIEKLRLNIGFQVEEAYNNTLIKGYKKLIEKDALRQLEIQTIITELTDLLPCLEVGRIPLAEYNDQTDEISIHIFDLHYGAENPKDIKGIVPFSPKVAKASFAAIAQRVNGLKAKKVHLFFGGDLIETFTGMNHPDSWKGIAAGHFGAHLVFETYQAIVNFALQINNLSTIVGVSGNHDRAASSNKEEDEGFIAEIIFKFIEISLPDVEVKFDRYIMVHKVDGICHIMNHGHFKLANVTPANLILEYGDVSCFNLLTSGHWHERQVKEDHRLFRQIVCPSILPGNMYSRKSGYSTSPGYLIVYRDRLTNKPAIFDYPL